jgi:hypothetical protein
VSRGAARATSVSPVRRPLTTCRPSRGEPSIPAGSGEPRKRNLRFCPASRLRLFHEGPPMNPTVYDVAILGSGMAGGMLGAVLARNGVKVLLIDAGVHPRSSGKLSWIRWGTALWLAVVGCPQGRLYCRVAGCGPVPGPDSGWLELCCTAACSRLQLRSAHNSQLRTGTARFSGRRVGMATLHRVHTSQRSHFHSLVVPPLPSGSRETTTVSGERRRQTASEKTYGPRLREERRPAW